MAVLSGSITERDKGFVETWENISATQNAIIRLGVQGEEKHEVIQGRRKFMLSTAERIITQDRILDKVRDPFTNGAFRPVTVPEDVTIESNPNAISDDEIQKVFKASDFAWAEYMNVIDSPETLRRMVDLSAESDDITYKRVRELEAKLAQVKPKTRITQKDQEQYDRMAPGGQGTVSADLPGPGQSRGAERRGIGGRSSDYRQTP